MLRDAELDDHLDLVIKQGLTTIASNTAVGGRSWFGSRQIAGPLPLRFGLWSLPTHAELPGQRGFALWSGSAKRGLRSIDAAIAERGVCHLTINGLALAAEGAFRLGRGRARAEARRQRRAAAGGLDVKTLAGTSATLAGGRQAGRPVRFSARRRKLCCWPNVPAFWHQ